MTAWAPSLAGRTAIARPMPRDAAAPSGDRSDSREPGHIEVLLEPLAENGGFGMPRAVNSRRCASQNARIRRGAIAVLDSNFLQKIRRLGVTGHWPRPRILRSGAATDLTVHDSSEPSFRA